jgi:hypothetical protein
MEINAKRVSGFSDFGFQIMDIEIEECESLLIYDGGSKQILWDIAFFSQIWLHTNYENRKRKNKLFLYS